MTLDDLGDRLFAYVPEVAQILGRDERTVRTAIRAGQIPATKAGQRYIVRVSWLREQAGQSVVAGVPDLAELINQVACRAAKEAVDQAFARWSRLLGANVSSQSGEAV